MNRPSLFLQVIAVLLAAAMVYALWPTGDDPRTPAADSEAGGPTSIGPGEAYLRGAHWFGEGWAVNFWNTRLLDRAAEDFAAIREDGFNTVILVIPWPGFAASETDGTIDPERARRLGALIDLAADADLNVVLRVGYAWDSSVPRSGRWLMRLWLREDVRQGWLTHIAGIWEIAKDRPNVMFAFLSWEDLWAVESLGERDLAERMTLAQRTGFRQWLRDYMSLGEVSARFGRSFDSFNEVPIPRRTEPAFGLFFDFIDDAWIERFFKPAQAVFPTMSMEIRIDSDPVWNAPGDFAYWHSHELAWDLPGAPWTTVYWAPPMGGENKGEILSPETAVQRLEYLMTRLRTVTGDRPILIGQFLVEDFTPGFEMNGRLERDDVGDFLELAEPVLESLTHGYALWTWRDYDHNAVASPDFSVLRGNWDGAKPDEDASPSYRFLAGEKLQRSFGIYEFHAPGGPASAALCVNAVTDGDTAPDLRVITDNQRQRSELDASGPGRACVDIDLKGITTVALEAISDLELFSVSFSGFTQPTGIRDLEGRRKPVADEWQAMNETLTVARPAPFVPFDDGWMGKTLGERLPAPSGDVPVEVAFRTNLPNDWPFQPELEVRLNGNPVGTVACANDANHVLEVEGALLREGQQDLAITVDRTHRPTGDERRLGCLVEQVELRAAQ